MPGSLLCNTTLYSSKNKCIWYKCIKRKQHYCIYNGAKQYIINNLIKVYTNFKWKFQIILDCTFCIFAFGEMPASRKCTLQKGLNMMHAFSPLIQKFHFKEVYLSRDILHCKMFLCLFLLEHY